LGEARQTARSAVCGPTLSHPNGVNPQAVTRARQALSFFLSNLLPATAAGGRPRRVGWKISYVKSNRYDIEKLAPVVVRAAHLLVRDYCQQVGIEITRCRPWRKNDQAWVERKNGAIVRRTQRLSTLRGSASRGGAGPLVCRDALVREFLPTLVR